MNQQGQQQGQPPSSDQAEKPKKGTKGMVMLVHRHTKRILMMPKMLSSEDLKATLDALEDGGVARADIRIESVATAENPIWVKICEIKVVHREEAISLRPPFLAEPEVIAEFMRDEAWKRLDNTFRTKCQQEAKAAGKKPHEYREWPAMKAAIDKAVAGMAVIEASKEEISARQRGEG